MHNDLDLIIKKYPQNWGELRVYAIGDVHVGSPNFDERAIKSKIQRIADDEHGVLVLCGDLGDYGLRNSKTNTYQATMQPREQIEYIYELFLPVVDKLTAAVPGNHEERLTKEVGTCPLYDLCVRWGVPEVYRENVAIMKLSFGSCKGNTRQYSFIGLTTHGTSRNKNHKFALCFDGIDFAISGHTHTPEYSPRGKIRIDSKSATASHVAYKEIVVDANLAPGGYSIKHEYEIPPPPELPYLELSGQVMHSVVIKSITYHTIQI